MIVGSFDERGRPFVSGSMRLPRFGIVAAITFLVDTGADGTCIHPRDGSPAGIPFDSLRQSSTWSGIGGQSQYFREPASLLLTDDTGSQVHGYEITANIAKPTLVSNAFPSPLGRDVINRWRMEYDPAVGRLEFTVRDADFIIAIE